MIPRKEIVRNEKKGRKYEFTGETCIICKRNSDPITLYRIRAVRDIDDYKLRVHIIAGTIGGWVESAFNISQEGNCWIYPGAAAYHNTHVRDSAQIYDYAEVYEDAEVYGFALLFDNVKVYGSAKIFEHVVLCGHVKVYGSAKVFCRAYISGYAEIFDYAKVEGHAYLNGAITVFGDAILKGDVNLQQPDEFSKGVFDSNNDLERREEIYSLVDLKNEYDEEEEDYGEAYMPIDFGDWYDKEDD